jgi:hypothetical protein
VSQRDSGYARKERDLYETPEWVTVVLLRHLRPMQDIWEPACGTGKMVRALNTAGFNVYCTDIDRGEDFLDRSTPTGWENFDAIITNPPYGLAVEFIWHAINLTEERGGLVAMLLRTDFDHAKTRADIFGECEQFAKKVVLTKRIRWFPDSKGSPSFNHAWFVWDWKHQGPPTLAYGP